jgi:hypothetical protein
MKTIIISITIGMSFMVFRKEVHKPSEKEIFEKY